MKHLILIILLLISTNTFSQIQFVGFDRNFCPQPMSNTYTYNHFMIGIGGPGTTYGYTIYKNGTAVYSNGGSGGNAKYVKDLLFINDSIGFLVYYSGYSANRVLRTEDFSQTWNEIGRGAPNYFGLYIIKSNFAYLVTQWNSPLQAYVARCSNLQPYMDPFFIYDQTITSDVFRKDTLLTSDLCGIDSLKIFLLNGIDTITYHINFILLNTGIPLSDTIQKTTVSVFPNPSKDFFQVSLSSSNIESVSLISLNGSELMTYDNQSIHNNMYSLYQISNGIYIVKISIKENIVYNKLIVNNSH